MFIKKLIESIIRDQPKITKIKNWKLQTRFYSVFLWEVMISVPSLSTPSIDFSGSHFSILNASTFTKTEMKLRRPLFWILNSGKSRSLESNQSNLMKWTLQTQYYCNYYKFFFCFVLKSDSYIFSSKVL